MFALGRTVMLNVLFVTLIDTWDSCHLKGENPSLISVKRKCIFASRGLSSKLCKCFLIGSDTYFSIKNIKSKECFFFTSSLEMKLNMLLLLAKYWSNFVPAVL